MNNAKPTPRAWIIEVIMFLTYAFFAVNWIAGSTFTPQIMEYFGLTSVASATLISNAITIAKIIGNFCAAGILVKLMPKKAIALGSLLIVSGCALAVFAPSYWIFVIGRFVMGFGGALYVVYFSPVVLHYFSGKTLPVVNTANSAAYNVGSILAMIIVAPVLAWLKSWKASMTFFAAISLVLFILWIIYGQNFEIAGGSKQKFSMSAALKEKISWTLPLTYSGLLTFYLVLLTLFPSSGISVISGTTLSTLVAVGGIFGSLAAIWLAKVYHKRLPVIRWGGLIMAAAGALMFFTSSPALSLIAAFLIGFFMFLPMTSLVLIPQELPDMTPAKLTAIMGLFWAISYIIETIVYFIIGFVVDGAGYKTGLVLALACSLTFFLGSFLLPETGKDK